jgi:hypothetical protein
VFKPVMSPKYFSEEHKSQACLRYEVAYLAGLRVEYLLQPYSYLSAARSGDAHLPMLWPSIRARPVYSSIRLYPMIGPIIRRSDDRLDSQALPDGAWQFRIDTQQM